MNAPPRARASSTLPPTGASAWLRALRPHQWSKNLLVFVPVIAAHLFRDAGALVDTAVMFVALCFAASAIYLLNDIADRESDSAHPRKRARPFASGSLDARAGAWVAIALIAIAFALTMTLLPAAASIALAVYLAGAHTYTLLLKRIVLVDVAALAGLYTVRLLAGGAATGVAVSAWLLGLGVALFTSIALAKRYAELREHATGAAGAASAMGGGVPGRGYRPRDLRWMRLLGLACAGVAAVLIAIYASSLIGERNYRSPSWLYALAPLVFAWLARVWQRASDGSMHDDPVVDAATDPAGLAIVAAGLGAFVAAL